VLGYDLLRNTPTNPDSGRSIFWKQYARYYCSR
jgi:hypothetical protein